MKKKLYRNPKDKKLAGVCSGLAEYFEIDVTLIRIIWILFVLLGG
ncbi:MAG: PspC domain-containing protein, partial [Candidatus Cloacimonetes bacterium]|nr:PspC domain-containing protein [Candidatus Cloacimonadota bacterium]